MKICRRARVRTLSLSPPVRDADDPTHLPSVDESLHVLHFDDVRRAHLAEVLEILPAAIEAGPDLVQKFFLYALALLRLGPSQCSVDDPTDRGDTERDLDVVEGEDVDGTAGRIICPRGEQVLKGSQIIVGTMQEI